MCDELLDTRLFLGSLEDARPHTFIYYYDTRKWVKRYCLTGELEQVDEKQAEYLNARNKIPSRQLGDVDEDKRVPTDNNTGS